ncbi:MAG: glutathione S-transferase family protein [Candidatus Marinimicrobia bacterium]|nr:glutathione S-transferase family protein [Candidatus Neomarinimicrobiota bacterium]MCF7827660.1 glutathione S-transferase family protein [Candidatus Neomarinimicrobiota bacterium]MCF7881285.1 glutathione S-transferase family protein [Candidatus Neomarinimicrobiota bacterium]
MGQLINGEWTTRNALLSDEKSGEFNRQASVFRKWVQDEPEAEYPAEANRYHLYISRACPWAHRTAILRRLKGLQDVISMSIVEPVRIDDGWEFSDKYPDPIHGKQYLRELYQMADSEFTGRVTVPTLWDTKTNTIVNNESSEIMRMFDLAFDRLATTDENFYPRGLQDQIDETIEAIYEPINNGVYRAGFAGTQAVHERAVNQLFEALDYWEGVLSEQRYLCGDRMTEADWCMFTTLFRFDSVYHTHFKCNVRKIIEYPNLWNFAKELYQYKNVAETCSLDHCKRHYYESHYWLNPTQLVAVGPDLDFDEPHNRDRFGRVA